MTDVALVTGAAGALGAEVARALSRRGDRVVLVDGPRSRPRLDELAATLNGACVVAGDLTDDATWNDALPRIERELGAPPSLAALIAGTWRGGTPLYREKDRDDWRVVMSANLETAHVSLARLLPAMVAGKRGSVVLVGSRAAEPPWTSAGAPAWVCRGSAAGVVAFLWGDAARDISGAALPVYGRA